MTTRGLDRIEKVLGLTLPAFYREFMANDPVEPGGRHAENREFASKPETVIGLNREVRRAGPVFDGDRWPEEFIVIGGTDRGDYFAINPAAGEMVLQWPWDDQCFVTVASSLR